MSKKILASFILLIAIRALLDLGYIYFVVPEFGYEGYKLAPEAGQYILSWVMYFMALPLTPTRLRKVSDAVFMLVTTSAIAPLTSIYGLSNESVVPVIMAIASMALVYAIANFRFFKILRIPYFHKGERVAIFISIFAVVIVVLHYLGTGVHLNLDLAKVYDYRSENAESAGGGIFDYLNSWVSKIFNIFLVAVFLVRKKYIFVVLLVLVQIFLFAASQHKSVLFAPFVVIGVWRYLRNSVNLLIIPLSLLLLVGGSLIVYMGLGNVMLSSLAVRRVLFTPAHLSFEYYTFFSVHPKIFWGDSFWMPLVHSPYPVTMPFVIGQYLGSPDLAANNGYVSSGFAQAGILGVLIYSVILGYALKFVDNESSRLGAVWLGVGLFLVPFLSIWRSADLATSMVTHGFLVMLLLLGLLRRPRRISAEYDQEREPINSEK